MTEFCKKIKDNQKIIKIILILVFLIGMLVPENNWKIIGFIRDYLNGRIIIELSDMAVILQVIPIVIVSFFSYKISKKALKINEENRKMDINLEYETKKELLKMKKLEVLENYKNLIELIGTSRRCHETDEIAEIDVQLIRNALERIGNSVYQFEFEIKDYIVAKKKHEHINNIQGYNENERLSIVTLLYKIKNFKDIVLININNICTLENLITMISPVIEDLENKNF